MEDASRYIVGQQWELIQPYEEILRQARNAGLTIEQLARQECWIELEKLSMEHSL